MRQDREQNVKQLSLAKPRLVRDEMHVLRVVPVMCEVIFEISSHTAQSAQ